MKKKMIVLILMFSLMTGLFADEYADKIKSLKGKQVEVLYTEIDKSEAGTLTEIGTSGGFLTFIVITTSDNKNIIMYATSIKSIKW